MQPSPAVPAALPGPPPMPVLGARGNLIAFMRAPLPYMRRLYETYGGVATLARGTADYVFTFTPEYSRHVINDTSTFFNMDGASMPVRVPEGSALARLFTGLIQMNGPRHRQQRRLIVPALHRARVAAYADAIVAQTERHLGTWRPGQVRDVLREMRALTLAIAVDTLLGLDPARGGRDVHRLLERWIALVFSVPALLLPVPLPGLPYHRLLALSTRLEAEIRALIAHKRAAADHDDVLSMLLRAHDETGACLTDDELVGQTNFLFMAGHATTTSALSWTLFLLSQHPDVAAGVADELDRALAGRLPTVDDLPELPLLEAVIKESMRLLPPVLWWSRVSTAPCTLGPYAVAEGAHVVYSAFITHRLPACYPEPERFLPERWRTCEPGPFEYIPFSAGPRMCLGATFAMVEMKLVLATLLSRFRLAPLPGSRVDHGGLMLSTPRPGLPMRVYRQDRSLVRVPVRGSIHRVVDLA